MGYLIRPVESLEKKLGKLARKDHVIYSRLMKKIAEIAESPDAYKPLRNVLKGNYRVHVGHFVLIFEIDDRQHLIKLKDFEHHDKVYF
ncbi:MAG: type II toxin-antitoxin system RelE/ParE family toxin [Candidatus Marsarchaeota archaeon]|nr:type II toxin-antitoxin system RelE/ParE family toxin [Candidatus Marsarchaeota archaeon]